MQRLLGRPRSQQLGKKESFAEIKDERILCLRRSQYKRSSKKLRVQK